MSTDPPPPSSSPLPLPPPPPPLLPLASSPDVAEAAAEACASSDQLPSSQPVRDTPSTQQDDDERPFASASSPPTGDPAASQSSAVALPPSAAPENRLAVAAPPVSLATSAQPEPPSRSSSTAVPSAAISVPAALHVVAPSSFLRRPLPVRLQQPNESGIHEPRLSETTHPSRPSESAHQSSPSSANAAPASSMAAILSSPKGMASPLKSMAMDLSKPMNQVDREQIEGLRAIRAFLRVRTSYDVLPLSFRLIVFDTALRVKKSLNILIHNGIVSAPLWDSKTSTFAGLLTTTDYLNVIQYYWQNPDQVHEIDQFTLNSLREIEKAIGAPPIETVSIHPEKPLYQACRMMVASRARRIPLVDIDDETKRAMIVSVITQYRILKFVAVNVKETQKLKKPLKELDMVGTYKDLATATMETPVMDVLHMLVRKSISSVPILDRDGAVINVFEAVDVIALIKGGVYDELNLTVGEALLKRNEDFSGIYTCSVWDRLDTIFDTIRKSRVHRLVVIDENSRLVGILTLSDILEYVLAYGAEDEDRPLE